MTELTTTQAAERLGIGIKGVLMAISRGHLRAERSGRTWRIRENDLTAYQRAYQIRAGERNGNVRLTAEDIPDIRRRIAAGDSVRVIARDYGVTKSTIHRIGTRETWGHVP